MRYAVPETEHEAERRHQTAMARLQQHQEPTTATRDEQFQKEYHFLVAYSDVMHARQEFEFACQKRHLIAELNVSTRVILEGTIQSLREAHNQSLRTFQLRKSKVST